MRKITNNFSLLTRLSNQQSAGCILIPNLLYFWHQYIYPVASQWSSVKVYEQNNQVIITLIVIKTFHICFFDIGLYQNSHHLKFI